MSSAPGTCLDLAPAAWENMPRSCRLYRARIALPHPHANNGDRFFGIEPDVFPHRVVVRPESLREFLVDDCDLLRCQIILPGKEAAGNQWNLHRLKVVV